MWESVRANNKKAVYHLIVCSEADVNAIHRQPSTAKSFIMPRMRNSDETPLVRDADRGRAKSVDRTASRSLSSLMKGKDASRENSLDGCSLLHLACQFADVGMVELLLQYGANVNAVDSRGRTPLHHCITEQKTDTAKVLLMRYVLFEQPHLLIFSMDFGTSFRTIGFLGSHWAVIISKTMHLNLTYTAYLNSKFIAADQILAYSFL